MNCSSIPDYTHTLDLVVALGGIPGAFFFSFSNDYPYHHYQSTKFQRNEQQEEKRGSDRLFLYGLYLLDYLTTNKFEQAADEAFIRERTDRAAEAYERELESEP